VLSVPQAPGLSTFLTGQAELADVIVPTSVRNLSIIPSGRIPLNPAELLTSGRLAQALEGLGGRFAHIVVDTGPIFGVSDATVVLAAAIVGPAVAGYLADRATTVGALEHAVAWDPRDPDLHLRLGHSYASLAEGPDYERARLHLETALRLRPSDAHARLSLA